MEGGRPLLVVPLGLVPYADAYALQKRIVAAKKATPSFPDVLLLLEHPEVYTWGRKMQDALPMLLPEVAAKSILIERGGEGTYHNPGQLVAYPIVRLETRERDVHKYMRALEESLIAVLAAYGVEGESRVGATGVWVQGAPKKIASLGVAISGWVTYHGVALNVTNELRGFSLIRPCGFEASVMTSLLERTNTAASLEKIGDELATAMAARLHRSRVDAPFSTLLRTLDEAEAQLPSLTACQPQ